MLRYVCSLPNLGLKGANHHYYYQDTAAGHAHAETWAQRENGPGRAVYDCIGLLADGAQSRCKETIAALDKIVVDLDLRNIVQPREEVVACLKGLLLPPSLIKDSGHGLHAEWWLKEPVADEAGMALAEALMKQLAVLLAGDPMPTHRAALMRRPGTDNTKEEDNWRKCRVLEQTAATYDTTALEEMLDEYGDRPLLTPKEKPRVNGHDHDGMAAEGPVDVEARYAAMEYMGDGLCGVHITKLHCTGSRTRAGWYVIDTVAESLEHIHRVAINDPRTEGWDWEEEKRDAEAMCYRIINKSHELAHLLPDDLYEAWQAGLDAGATPKVVHSWRAGWHVIRTRDAIAADPTDNRPGTDTPDDGDGGTRAPGADKPENAGNAAGPGKHRKGKVWAIPFRDFDEASLERRAHLYAHHYQRGQVTATIGPGGAGKSSLDLVEVVAMATCRNLLGEQPAERCRVWVHNGDDDTKEMKRRIAAICRHYNISKAELEGWLFMTSKSDFDVKVASGNGSLVIDRRTVQNIIQAITENGIDVAVFEPLVTLHAVAENDNVKMNAVIHIFGEIADGCDCAVELCHHTRKLMAGTDEYSSDDGRGASAIRDAVRCSRVLNTISREEARKAGIDEQERAFYFRVDGGKANYLPPASRATWRKFENVRLLNDDNVGVVTAWEFQAAQSALSDEDCEKIQAEVRKGTYRENKQRSPERWVGRVIAKYLKLNPNEESSEWKIKRGQRDLENKGVIAYQTLRLVGDHKEVSYAIAGPWRKPDAT